jgi:hypothetical protein
MFSTTRSRFLAAGAVGIAVAALPMTAFAGTSGTGSVTTVVSATTIPGALTIAGAGVNVGVSQAPGTWGSATGLNTLTVADTTGTTNGWAVTATYSDPAVGTGLGGNNVEVSSANVLPSALGGVASANVSTVTDVPLSTPVTVLTTGLNSGAGVTAADTSLKVRVPQTAQVGDVFGGVVTYTVASVR